MVFVPVSRTKDFAVDFDGTRPGGTASCLNIVRSQGILLKNKASKVCEAWAAQRLILLRSPVLLPTLNAAGLHDMAKDSPVTDSNAEHNNRKGGNGEARHTAPVGGRVEHGLAQSMRLTELFKL
jgi:hypothetical protein